MRFLDFLRPPAYRDPVVGVLVRSGRYWRGTMGLGSTSGVALLLAGPRTAPEESRLALARELGDRYAALRPAIERALFEHYEPYADAAEPDLPRLRRSEQVWGHVAPVHVRIEPLGGLETVEIAYRTDWDTEHTVGARFQGWVLTELNGSVVQMIGEILAELVGEAAFGRLGRSQRIQVALRVGFGLLGTFLGVAGAVHFWRTPGSISNPSLHASVQALFAFLACFSLFNIALKRSRRWPGAGFVPSFVALFATRILCRLRCK